MDGLEPHSTYVGAAEMHSLCGQACRQDGCFPAFFKFGVLDQGQEESHQLKLRRADSNHVKEDAPVKLDQTYWSTCSLPHNIKNIRSSKKGQDSNRS